MPWVTAKWWLQSRTIRIALLLGALAGINAAAGFVTDARILNMLMAVEALVFAALRTITIKPVKLRRPDY